MTAELTRLSKENAELREQLQAALMQAAQEESEERERTITALGSNTVPVAFFYDDSTNWEQGRDVSLYDAFSLLAPELLIEKSTRSVANYLGLMLNNSDRVPRSNYPIPSNTVKSMMADLITLELVEPSSIRTK